jgi:hypothetical protein
VSCVFAATGVLLLLSSCLHAPFIVSRRCRVTECGRVVRPLLEESRGLERALSGGDVICTVEAWRRYFWYCWYVSGMGTTVKGVVSIFRCCSDASYHS